MGRGYNNHHHHYLHQRNLQLHYKSTFLPMLCSRPAIKEVVVPRLEDRSKPFSVDPLSPKIGCMGQVKRNNRITGIPTTSSSTTTTPNHRPDQANTSFKYSKLKKIFSGKNLTSTTTTSTCSRSRGTAAAATNVSGLRSGSCRMRREGASATMVSIEDMDPPLPVVRKVAERKQVDDAGSLWQRRRSGCGGGAHLKGLKVQQVHMPPLVLPTTV